MRFLIPLRHDLRRTNSNRTDPLKALIVAHIDMRLLEKVRIKPVLILRQGISFGFLVDGFEDLEPHFATNLLLTGAVLVFGDVEDGGLFWGAAVDGLLEHGEAVSNVLMGSLIVLYPSRLNSINHITRVNTILELPQLTPWWWIMRRQNLKRLNRRVSQLFQ